MRRAFLLYGCPQLLRRWWGEPGKKPPNLPEGFVWMVVAQVFEDE